MVKGFPKNVFFFVSTMYETGLFPIALESPEVDCSKGMRDKGPMILLEGYMRTRRPQGRGEVCAEP